MKIKITDTGLIQKLTGDYLSGKDTLTPFYVHRPDIQSVEKAIHTKQANYTFRTQLVTALKQQYKTTTPIPEVLSNIDKLALDNTFTVTTAHQPNLFGGPLYFVFKILSAIAATHKMKQQYPAYNFVPVYWMGSEDHDAAELNHIFLFNSKIEWTAPGDGAFGRLPTETLAPLIEEIKTQLGTMPFAHDTEALLKRCYLQNDTIAHATHALVNELFGKYGLVIVDGDDHNLKELYIPVITDELKHHTSKQLTEATSSKLKELGYTPQATARHINLFYLDNNERARIEQEGVGVGDTYTIAHTDKKFTKEEILQLAHEQPRLFSPNVILRGLYQETVLPNIAFIGGGAEVSYWLQLKSLFENYKVPYPIIMLRDSAMLTETSFEEKWAALGFTIYDLFKDEATLIKDFLAHSDEATYTNFSKEIEEAANAFESIKNKLYNIDKTLAPATEAEFVKVQQIIDGLKGRGTKAMKRKNEQYVQSIKNNKGKYFPDGVLQERHHNFLMWYARYGSGWMDSLLQEFNPFENTLTILPV